MGYRRKRDESGWGKKRGIKGTRRNVIEKREIKGRKKCIREETGDGKMGKRRWKGRGGEEESEQKRRKSKERGHETNKGEP